MKTSKSVGISSSEWKTENQKAENAIRSFYSKLPSESVREEFYHRCRSRFYEFLTKSSSYPYSFYKECFHKIYVDMCRKNRLYLHTYSKPSTSPVFLNEPTSFVDPTSGVSKTEVLHEAISHLTIDEQLIVYLIDFCNLTTSQVAKLLGKDQSTYSRQHKKIVLKMKEWILKKWGDEIWSI